jgi:hypothetical protein
MTTPPRKCTPQVWPSSPRKASGLRSTYLVYHPVFTSNVHLARQANASHSSRSGALANRRGT